jgi:hypothetical protein
MRVFAAGRKAYVCGQAQPCGAPAGGTQLWTGRGGSSPLFKASQADVRQVTCGAGPGRKSGSMHEVA